MSKKKNNSKSSAEQFSKRISIFSLVFLISGSIFAYGLAVGNFKMWPFKTIESVYSGALSLLRYGELVPVNRLIKAPKHVSRERFVTYKADKVQPGYYAYMGYDGEKLRYAAWLHNEKGEKIHEWDLSYLNFDPDGPLNGSDSPHAFKVLADGSVIVTFDSGDVMARIDKCSNPLWTKKGVYHHSLTKGLGKTMWAWRGDNTAYGHFNYLSQFDTETGETLTEIGLVEDLIRSPATPAGIFSVRADYPFKKWDKTPGDKMKYDLFHPNDIDVLSVELADKFPMFKAGDLLMSFRRIHLVAVVDPLTYEIKWARNGPWIYQHDPDFTADGKISVYSNNSGLGRSEIIKIDPATGELTNELLTGDLKFYSAAQGKHQYLPNGNLLIMVPDEGRAVQVTASGDKVFEHNNISAISPLYNEHIANGIWFDTNYFTEVPSCTK